MIAKARGNMACMEDHVVFCVCVKELCLSGTLVGFFEKELFPLFFHRIVFNLGLKRVFKWCCMTWFQT